MSWWDGVTVRGRREDGSVAEIRIRQGARQTLQMGAAIALVADLLTVLAPHGEHFREFFLIAYPVFVLVLNGLLAFVTPGLRLTEQALEFGALGGAPMLWPAVREIRTRRFWGTTQIVVVAVDGTVRKVRGPVTGFPYDRDFDRKLSTLQTWWALRRGW